MPKKIKRMLQVAAVFIALGFLVMFGAFVAPEDWVNPLFVVGGVLSSIGALAAVSASIGLVINLLRE